MTYLEIDKALYNIVMEKYNECDSRLNEISKESKSEYKAVMIEREMYMLCNRAGLMFHVDNPVVRERSLQNRTGITCKIMGSYPKLNEIYNSLSDDDKKIFIAALQAEIYMRDQIYMNYLVELEQAKGAGDAKNIFEFGIKVGAVERVFEAWEEWREKNNVFPGLMGEIA